MSVRGRIEELEYYFEKFPVMSKESIIKTDIFRLGLRFSQAAMGAAEGCRLKDYRIFSVDMFDPTDFEAVKKTLACPDEVRISKGQYNLLPTIMTVCGNPRSPYLIDLVEGGKKVLFAEGGPLAEVEYPPRPRAHDKTSEDGRPYSELAPVSAWGHMVQYNPFVDCHYWWQNQECLYCDIGSTKRAKRKALGKDYVEPDAGANVEEVAEAIATVFAEERDPETRPTAVCMTSGTIFPEIKVRGKDEDEFYLQYVEAIKARIGDRYELTLITGSKDIETLKRYKAAGVDCHAANLEIWDARVFQTICRGKGKAVSHEERVKRILDSVDIFGEGHVAPALIAGVELAQPYGFNDIDEAVESTTAGLEFLMSHGVTPYLNQWFISGGSALRNHPLIPLEYFLRIYQNYYETWKKWFLPTPQPLGMFGMMGPGRAVWPNGGFMDVAY